MEHSNSVTMHGRRNGRRHGMLQMDPVFVLCMGRSGSTLLRLILDTHPDLACPPETNIPTLCSQLAVVWSLIEGAPLALHRGDAPPAIPDAAIAGIRQTMDLMTAPYLKRRGKRLFCDKSLGAAMFAELLMRIYPGTRFICLFRHPMDVISSGLEACPWGLTGYGFDQYIAASPGNAVMALARYWDDQAQAIAAVEEKYPNICYRVRYEDLVLDPERISAEVFDFIGVGQVSDISRALFMHDHERLGPSDHKIWHTSTISRASVGRSDSVPSAMIPPPILESINVLLGKLSYVPIDEKWGTADMPASLVVPDGSDQIAARTQLSEQNVSLPDAAALADRLAAGLAQIDSAFVARWQARMAETFTIAIRQPNSDRPAWWRLNLASRELVRGGQSVPVNPDNPGHEEDVDWSIVGDASAWLEVLSARLNLSAALRRNELRYCDFGENDMFVSEARVALLAALLGLSSWVANLAIASRQAPTLADIR